MAEGRVYQSIGSSLTAGFLMARGMESDLVLSYYVSLI